MDKDRLIKICLVLYKATEGFPENEPMRACLRQKANDILEGRSFPDVIAKGGPRGPDAHSVTGLWGDGVVSTLTKPYDIPYSCIVPKKIDNLLVAGRCISSTHLAFGAIRDQATCMSTGEAAGAAAALSAKLGVTPRNIDIKLLQKLLLGQEALLFLEDEKAREKEILTYIPTT